MSRRSSAFMYVEPDTRFHVGGVFPDRETATLWAERVAADRGESAWTLHERLDGRWRRVGPRRVRTLLRRRHAAAAL